MSITKSKTRAAALSHVQALVAGTQKHFPAGSFTLGNAQYTTASLVQLLQGLADTMSALSAARAARGTTSRKQKLAVKGNVTGITVTPLTTPVATPPPPPVSNPPSAPVPGTVSK